MQADTRVLTPTALLAVDVVVFTLRPAPVNDAWQVLLVPRSGDAEASEVPGRGGSRYALPGVVVDFSETFDAAARRALLVKAGLDARDWYLEQLATFGSPTRDSRARVASVAHIALVRSDDVVFHEVADGAPAEWWPVSSIPWDDLAFRSTREGLRDYLAGLLHPVRV